MAPLEPELGRHLELDPTLFTFNTHSWSGDGAILSPALLALASFLGGAWSARPWGSRECPEHASLPILTGGEVFGERL